MKNSSNIIYFLSTFLLIISCTSVSKKEPSETINPILSQLQSIKGKGILFGHQDDLAYGINWKYIDGESDVKRVAGDYPALFGWELGGIELGHEVNLDSVPFDEMRRLAVKAHEMGGINTFSWHPYSVINGVSSWNTETVVVKHILPGGSHHQQFIAHLDKVADFFLNLKNVDGENIPFIFRPWHEMDGTWFWWGSNVCTSEEFKKLFRFSVEYLRKEKGIENMLVAYSPDRNFNSEKEYLTWYPGDDIVDIIGLDNYHDFKLKDGYKEVIRKLHIVIDVAKEKNKISALTETGLENVTDPTWFSSQLGKVLSDSIISNELSYAMVWRNDPKVHFFFPYPGHLAEKDAKKFLDRSDILLLNEFNQLKK